MTIGVVGCGLIGGSIGLACRSQGHRVIAAEPDAEAAQIALSRGCADSIGTLSDVASSELVFVCVPPDAMIPVLTELATEAGSDTTITDCASVKGDIVEWLIASGDPRIVPGHPMAGHEKSGPKYASAWMFRGAKWILTPTKLTATSARKKVEGIVKEMGATPVLLPAEVHDRDVAVLSHLPHALAAILVRLGSKLDSTDASAGSWQDLTRVGGVDPNLWTQITLANRRELVKVLREFGSDMDYLATSLESGDEVAVRTFFVDAKLAKEGKGEVDSSARGID